MRWKKESKKLLERLYDTETTAEILLYLSYLERLNERESFANICELASLKCKELEKS